MVRWIYRRVAENMPYDKLVEGIVLATEQAARPELRATIASEMGSYLRKQDPAGFRRRARRCRITGRATTCASRNEKALSFSYAFLGVRLQCAECHKHPFDQWTQQDFKQFTAFFNRVNFGIAAEDQADGNERWSRRSG